LSALLAGAGALAASALAQAQKAPTVAELKAQGARQMTGGEIASSRTGNTWYYFRLADGAVLAVYYRDDRNRFAVTRGQKRHTLWWMEGDRACDEAVTTAGHICATVWHHGNQMYGCADGEPACAFVVRQVPGNPENL
jgi:hypothetical protein